MDKNGDLYDKNKMIMLDFGYSYDGVGCKRIIKLLNYLNDENEQLKQELFNLYENHIIIEKSNNSEHNIHRDCIHYNTEYEGLKEQVERLLDFKDNVFNIITKKIKNGEQAIEWGESIGANVGAMGFHIEMLKMLLKELQD